MWTGKDGIAHTAPLIARPARLRASPPRLMGTTTTTTTPPPPPPPPPPTVFTNQPQHHWALSLAFYNSHVEIPSPPHSPPPTPDPSISYLFKLTGSKTPTKRICPWTRHWSQISQTPWVWRGPVYQTHCTTVGQWVVQMWTSWTGVCSTPVCLL